jgi:RNA polymerase sigma factor (sigma-70 family)
MEKEELLTVRDDLKSHASRMLSDKIRSRVNSSDLVQETLIITITKLTQLTSCSKAAIYMWMLRVMRYRILYHNREINKEKRRNSRVCINNQVPDSFLEGIIKNEFMELILMDLKKQKEENRLIFQMRYIEGMDLESISIVSGKSINSIRSILYRIILDLRKSLSEEVILR